tara:strand:- start:23400 stop:23747 length:348 start_codon:yes stop_codon:yes gene_type:complete
MKTAEIILDVSKKFLQSGYFDAKVKSIVYKTDDGGEVDNKDTLVLMKYIQHCQQFNLDNGKSELSIRDMKNNIFRMIGVDTSNTYGSTISRDEIKTIYTFFVNLPAEVFEYKKEQ